LLSDDVTSDELHEALRQLGTAMRAPTITGLTGLRGGGSHAAALVPQPYSHAAAPVAPTAAPAATTTASAKAPAPAPTTASAYTTVAATAVPSAPSQELVPPPDAGRDTAGQATAGQATGGRAPPPDELLPAERWLIENRPRLAAIAGQALGADVGADVGANVGGVSGGGVGVPSPPLGYRPPSYLTEADGMARPSLGPSYLDPSYLDPSYHGPSYHDPSYHSPNYHRPSYLDPSYHAPSHLDPSYHEQPWHHPREDWALDPSSEPAAQLDALRDRISSLISAATTALHTTNTTAVARTTTAAAAAAAAAVHAAGAPAQSQPSTPPAAAPPVATAAPLPPAETYHPSYPLSSCYGAAAAAASPMELAADLPSADGAHPPRATAGWALAPDTNGHRELRPYGAESRRLAPALAGPSYDVSYDLPSAPAGHHHHHRGGGGMGAPFGHWSHLSDSVTTSSDVARERLRHDVQVWTHARDHTDTRLASAPACNRASAGL